MGKIVKVIVVGISKAVVVRENSQTHETMDIVEFLKEINDILSKPKKKFVLSGDVSDFREDINYRKKQSI